MHTVNRLATAHEWCEWPELIRCEKRYLRADYDSTTTYAAGDVVYYASTDKYYQASQCGYQHTANSNDSLGSCDALS